MTVSLSFIGGAGWQFFSNNGAPLSGGKIYTYAAGTTTPLATYTARDGLTANSNPIILDAAGRTPQQIWSTEGLLYKYVVKNAGDVTIRTWDNIGGSVVASDLSQDLASTDNNSLGDALIGFKQNNVSGFITGAVSRTVNGKLTEIVSVKDFGAVGDGVTNDSAAIQAGIDALSVIYLSTGKPQTLFFPSGIYVERLVYLKPGVNLLGFGDATLLKTPAGTETDENILKNWRMVTVNPVDWREEAWCNHRTTIQGLIFDGNLANMNWTNNTYSQEQAHCLFLTGPSAAYAKSLTHRTKWQVLDCHFQNSVADGLSFYINSDLIVENITANNCFRGGLTVTGGNSHCTVRGYIGENARVDFEVDGVGFGGTYRLDVDIDGVIVDQNGGGLRPGGIDFGGTSGGFFYMRNVQVFTPPFNFIGATGDPQKLIQNCYFTIGGRSAVANRFVRPTGTFENCTFYVKEQSGVTQYTALHMYPSFIENAYINFVRCTFELDPAIKINTPTADCDVFRSNASAISTSPYNNGLIFKFDDCLSVGAWDKDFYVLQGGTLEVNNGSYSAVQTFNIGSSVNRPVLLTISGDIELKSTVSTVFNAPTQTTITGAYVQFINVSFNRAFNIASTWSSYPIIGSYSFPVDAAPVSQGALRGAVARKNTLLTTTGQWGTIEWTATSSSTTAATWSPTQYQVGRSTTANRPTLGVSDVGVIYLDTTLDANGRPIWWNGTAWVNSVGTVV